MPAALPRPADRVAGATAYRVPAHPAPLDLDLRGNEGAEPDLGLLTALGDPALLRQYPDARALEAALAAAAGVAADAVIATAGGDDALDRLCRALLQPGRDLVLPSPGFEMTARYARLAGGAVRAVPWPGSRFPREAVLAAVDAGVGLVAITSPNNPTGAVAGADDLRAVAAAAAAVGAGVLVDLAYVEFADPGGPDLQALALELGNCVVVRTFSKAWGLAGLRVGWAIGPAPLIGWMRAAGAPYAVSGPSLAMAAAALRAGDAGPRRFAAEVRARRAQLGAALADGGLEVVPSQANFAFARGPRARWLADALAGLGIGIRSFPDRPELADAVRVGCPTTDAAAARVAGGIRAALRPDALLLDMDGVMVDVSSSYRAAILQTGAAYGVTLTSDEVRAAKAAGDANNDWVLTQRLLAARGVAVGLVEVTATFEALYQGGPGRRGLREAERLLADRPLLEALAARVRLGVVTGRPRADAYRLLELHGLADLFGAVVCMEDAPAKPDPAPVRLALTRLGAARAWMVGDTPDDQRAARAAGVVPLGVLAPGDPDPAPLLHAGAARILPGLHALLELLP